MPLEQVNPDPRALLNQKEEITKDVLNSPDIPNRITAAEIRNYSNKEEEAKLRERETHLEGLKQDIKERKTYARYIFWLIVGWLITILVIVILGGRGILRTSDTVLVTLITTTTANIAAFFLGVIRYLFPNHNFEKELRK